MFRSTFCLYLYIFFITQIYAQEPEAFRVFDKNGKTLKFSALVKDARTADVVFFGEIHNSTIAHWLQIQIFKELIAIDSNIQLGMEMLEADNQILINEYLKGTIAEKSYLAEIKKWDNYLLDYHPLVSLAKKNNISVIATNIPRRYANAVYKNGLQGLDSLDPVSRKWIVPLPFPIDYNLSLYKSLIEHTHGDSKSSENFVLSQAIKDATMAFFINKNFKGKVFHVNGSYHSQSKEGIVWYLNKYNKEYKIITIQTVEQKNIDRLDAEYRNLADFLIAVPEDFPKSY